MSRVLQCFGACLDARQIHAWEAIEEDKSDKWHCVKDVLLRPSRGQLRQQDVETVVDKHPCNGHLHQFQPVVYITNARGALLAISCGFLEGEE